MQELSTSDPIEHVRNVRASLNDIVAHLRRDVLKVADPKAQALFETAAEVLLGLSQAFDHYGQKNEPSWR
jgi:hypothetical protein